MSHPQLVKLVIEDSEPQTWFFSEVIELADNFQIQLHQGKDNVLKLYHCLSSDRNIAQIKCELRDDEVPLSSPIKLFSYGVFGGEDVFAIVLENQPQSIKLYTYAGIKSSHEDI